MHSFDTCRLRFLGQGSALGDMLDEEGSRLYPDAHCSSCFQVCIMNEQLAGVQLSTSNVAQSKLKFVIPVRLCA